MENNFVFILMPSFAPAVTSPAAERRAPSEPPPADAHGGCDDWSADDGCGDYWGRDHMADNWRGDHHARDRHAVVDETRANGVRWQHDGGGWQQKNIYLKADCLYLWTFLWLLRSRAKTQHCNNESFSFCFVVVVVGLCIFAQAKKKQG